MKNVIILLLSVFLLQACTNQTMQINDVGNVNGIKPVYVLGNVDWQEVTMKVAIPMEKLGKIYYKNGFIFVSEKYKGIHVINNQDPTNPVKVKFIEIIGNKDIAIKGNRLYADNYTDFITVDISDFENIKVLSRMEGFYPAAKQDFPEDYQGYFECVDDSKGIVIDWEEAVLQNPNCWR